MVEADTGRDDDNEENRSYRDTPGAQRGGGRPRGLSLPGPFWLLQARCWRRFGAPLPNFVLDLRHGSVERFEMLIELLIDNAGAAQLTQ
jgi:hypothetical protein